MLKFVVTVIIFSLVLINIASYQFFRAQVGGRAHLSRYRHASDGDKMYYLCPGILSHAHSSFNFAFPILEDGGVTLVDYINTGAKPKEIAKQIARDVDMHNFNPVLITISWGETIARHFDTSDKKADIISIDPCTSLDDTKRRFDVLITLLMPLVQIGYFILGWISYLPIIKAPEKNYSLSLVANQLGNLWTGRDNKEIGHNTWGLILSKEDEFLDGDWLEEKYQLPNERVEYVDSTHANTIQAGRKYQTAVSNLL